MNETSIIGPAFVGSDTLDLRTRFDRLDHRSRHDRLDLRVAGEKR